MALGTFFEMQESHFECKEGRGNRNARPGLESGGVEWIKDKTYLCSQCPACNQRATVIVNDSSSQEAKQSAGGCQVTDVMESEYTKVRGTLI